MNRRGSDESKATPEQRGEPGDGSKAMLEQEAERARETAREAAEAGKQRLQSRAGEAAESVDHIAEAVGSAASRLSEMEHEGLADYANRLASWLGDMSETLRSKNIDEITGDISRLAQRNPALFLLGSVAVGLGLSRFAKASGKRQYAPGDAEWSEESVSESEFEPYEPSMSPYESRERSAGDRAADRPITPDSTGGGGL